MPISNAEIREIIDSAKVVKNFAELDDETTFTDHGVDSLDLFSILLAIEEHYGFSISAHDAPSLVNVSAIVSYVQARLDAQEG